MTVQIEIPRKPSNEGILCGRGWASYPIFNMTLFLFDRSATTVRE
jgi:hypothetical protein